MVGLVLVYCFNNYCCPIFFQAKTDYNCWKTIMHLISYAFIFNAVGSLAKKNW